MIVSWSQPYDNEALRGYQVRLYKVISRPDANGVFLDFRFFRVTFSLQQISIQNKSILKPLKFHIQIDLQKAILTSVNLPSDHQSMELPGLNDRTNYMVGVAVRGLDRGAVGAEVFTPQFLST